MNCRGVVVLDGGVCEKLDLIVDVGGWASLWTEPVNKTKHVGLSFLDTIKMFFVFLMTCVLEFYFLRPTCTAIIYAYSEKQHIYYLPAGFFFFSPCGGTQRFSAGCWGLCVWRAVSSNGMARAELPACHYQNCSGFMSQSLPFLPLQH